MKSEILFGLITSIAGFLIGFFGNYFIAKYNARNELKKSMSEHRAKFYLELWKLCNRQIDERNQQLERRKEIQAWYEKGGGLLLPFKATDRLIGASNILEISQNRALNENELAHLKENLSWLRTEMKFAVGSYSRKEAHRTLPNLNAVSQE